MNSELKRNRPVEEKQLRPNGGEPLALVTRMGEIWADWNQEVTRFAGVRLQHDVEYGASLMACKDAGEILQAQQTWLSTAFIDYAKEWPKLFQLATLRALQ